MLVKSIAAALLVACAATSAFAQLPPQGKSPLNQAATALQPSAVQLPSESDQVRLVDETLDIFLEAVKARSMEAVHAHASQLLQRQFTVERLNEVFKEFFKVPVTGRPLQGVAPVFTVAAEPVGATAFKLQGYYPTQPQTLSFDVTYIREGLSWKWVALNVRINAANAKPGT